MIELTDDDYTRLSKVFCKADTELLALFIGYVPEPAVALGVHTAVVARLREQAELVKTLDEEAVYLRNDLSAERNRANELQARVIDLEQQLAGRVAAPPPAASGDWPPVVTDAMVREYMIGKGAQDVDPEFDSVANYPQVAKGLAAVLAMLPRPEQVTVWGVPEGWRLVPVEPTRMMVEFLGSDLQWEFHSERLRPALQKAIDAAPPPPPAPAKATSDGGQE